MLNKESIDNKNPIDARIVQTVRKLKSINNSNLNQNNNFNINIQNSINKKNKKSENDLVRVERGFSKKGTKISTAERSVINSINNGASNPGSANYLKKQDSKISIDGSLHNSINQKLLNNNINAFYNNININNNYSNNILNENNINKQFIKQNSFNNNNFKKKFDYETLKKYIKKPKTEYQKNILSENNIIKYKTECLNLIKKDKELKNLLIKIGINNNKDEYENYIDNTLFNKEYFLVALEMLLLEESQESNTLAVFRKNKNQLPLKVLKENFYKDFMLKDINKKIYDSDYNFKYKNFIKILDEKIENVKNFKIIK